MTDGKSDEALQYTTPTEIFSLEMLMVPLLKEDLVHREAIIL